MAYVVIEWEHRYYQFVQCPSCKGLIQITGAKKPLKVRVCVYCGHCFVEEA